MSGTDEQYMDDFELDLDGSRSARVEVTDEPRVVRIGGLLLEVPAELPLDVLEPLTTINVDISVLIRQVLDARNSAGAQEEILGAVVDMLMVNPSLPTEVIDCAKTMAQRLFGDEGYAHLVEQRLYLKDVGLLVKWLMRRYGVGLGEASPSSDSSEGTGTTSKPTSPGATTVTSATSGGRRRTRAS